MKFHNLIPFYNELDLLEIRLNTMTYVNNFIVCEMDTTHSGQDKPFYFEEARKQPRFQKWEDKIYHIKIKSPRSKNPWENENYQRDVMAKYMSDFCYAEDFFIVQDADEILNEKFIEILKNWSDPAPIAPALHFYRYFVNAEIVGNKQWWTTGPMVNCEWFHESEMTLTGLRNLHPQLRNAGRVIYDCGWHFTFLGGAKAISQKMKAYAHQESNTEFLTDEKRLQKALEEYKDACNPKGPPFVKKELTEDDFPKYLVRNRSKFENIIL